jgi:hypothetical protein
VLTSVKKWFLPTVQFYIGIENRKIKKFCLDLAWLSDIKGERNIVIPMVMYIVLLSTMNMAILPIY